MGLIAPGAKPPKMSDQEVVEFIFFPVVNEGCRWEPGANEAGRGGGPGQQIRSGAAVQNALTPAQSIPYPLPNPLPFISSPRPPTG